MRLRRPVGFHYWRVYKTGVGVVDWADDIEVMESGVLLLLTKDAHGHEETHHAYGPGMWVRVEAQQGEWA